MAGSDWNTCQLLRSYSPKRSEFSPDRFRKVSGRRVQPWFVRIVEKNFRKSWQPPRLFSNLVDTVETLEVCSRAKSWVKSFFSCDCPLQNLVNAHMNDVWTVPMSFQKGTTCLLRKRVVRLLIFKHWVRFMSHSLEQRNSEILAVWKWVLIAGWKPGGVLMLFWLCLTLFRLGPVRRSCPTARSLLLKKRVMFVNFWWLGRQANATVSPTSSAPSFVSALTKESIGSNGSTV